MDEIFVIRLKELMENNEYTNIKLARQLGVSRSTICKYVKGTRKPDINTINSIAIILNSNVLYLSGIIDNPNKIKETRDGDTIIYTISD